MTVSPATIWRNAPATRVRPGAGQPNEEVDVAHRITDLPERFRRRIEIAASGCWLWTGRMTQNGYPVVWWQGSTPVAHRVIYQLLVGPINEETLDHLCRVRHCVNPSHVEPVSMRENTLRGNTITAAHAQQTHCKYGHPFDEENTYYYGPERRWRRCRACDRRRSAAALGLEEQ